MKRLESIQDDMNGTVTYELPDGRCVRFDAKALRESGLAKMMKAHDLERFIPTERVPVMQRGRRVGTVPGDFDLVFARSRSPLYDVRPGDLTRQGDVWVAARNLGASDLDCLIGFRRDDSCEHERRQEEIRNETLAAFQAQPETPPLPDDRTPVEEKAVVR